MRARSGDGLRGQVISIEHGSMSARANVAELWPWALRKTFKPLQLLLG
jgi:hypothetical protein